MTDRSAPSHPLHWLPNTLTVGRIMLIPVLVWALLKGVLLQNYGMEPSPLIWTALGIFLFCMASDFFDGFFARKWKVTSDFGRMLDPIADKLLVAAALIAICILHNGQPAILIPALAIIGRDITVSGVREYAALGRKVMPPTKLAKWKTAAEMLAILLYLLSAIFGSNAPKGDSWALDLPNISPETSAEILATPTLLSTGFIILLWTAAVLSLYTGWRYFRAALVKTDVIDGPLDP